MLVAVCFHRFGPYHVARLAAAAGKMNIVGIEFSASTSEYAWDAVESSATFRRVVVFPEGDIRGCTRNKIVRRIWDVMDEIRPDVVAVNGWSAPDALAALLWARYRQIPVVMMSDSTAVDFTRSTWKEWIKRRLLKNVESGFVGGTAHSAYLESLGVPESRIFYGYDAVDNDYFMQESSKRRALERPSILPNRPFFLASNRFMPKKNLERLLIAYAEYYCLMGENAWEFVLLGDGDLRQNLENLTVQLGIESPIHMPGFVQYEELPNYYAWANVFIHASTSEQWGLVVNEAMASGLPVLVSERCGCAPDLVKNGINGYTFNPYNVSEIVVLMHKLSSKKCDLTSMGESSLKIINSWSPELFSKGLAQAVNVAQEIPVSRLGLLDKALLHSLSYR